MDIWFLEGFKRIIDMEEELKRCRGVPSADTLKRAKEMCFADSYIGTLCGMKQAEVKALREKYGIIPAFKMVDTCAAEFEAETPYYYSSYDEGERGCGHPRRPQEGPGAGLRPHPHRSGHRV